MSGNQPRQPSFLYVGDPMCSWCYGFGPELEIVRQATGLPIMVIAGGLRPGDQAEPLDAALKQFLHAHWLEVAEATGLPFQMQFFEREGFLYDTAPACQAVVAMRTIQADAAFPFLRALSHAFFAENVNLTSPGELERIASVFVEPSLFARSFTRPETLEATYQDFHFAAADLGVRGFPALFLVTPTGVFLVAHGYQKAETLLPVVEQALKPQAERPK
ncbi:MAG: DsbA family protein [Spirochaetales bacterium]|nr:DsbA family protein [Spirochaetales bacterium]